MQILSMPNDEFRLGDALIEALADERINRFMAAIAFAKISGVRHVRRPLADFVSRGGVFSIIVGIDHLGTTKEALEQLLGISEDTASQVVVFHNENGSTFHPKVYLLYGDALAIAFLGSSNLTEGGLYTNYEVDAQLILDLSAENDRSIFEQILKILDTHFNDASGLAVCANRKLLDDLEERGLLPTELFLARERSRKKIETELSQPGSPYAEPRFPRVKVRRAPFHGEEPAIATDPQAPEYEGFLMTLMRTDAGRGQTTAGTSPRSPEVFVPLAARNANADFWGWPDLFIEDPTHAGKMDRAGVIFRMGGRDIQVNMMTWPDKADFRLRSSALIEEMTIGDILRIEKTENSSYQYYAEVIPQGTSLYARYLSLCTNAVRNSEKKWGYY